MNLLYKRKELTEGYQTIVNPGNSPLQWLEFARLFLPDEGLTYEGEANNREMLIALLRGEGEIFIQGDRVAEMHYKMGPRWDVFSDLATMVYLPPGVHYRLITTAPGFDAGVFKTPAEAGGAPCLITPDKLVRVQSGVSNWQRDVTIATKPPVPVQKLLAGETICPPGNWSSYPPHKHDTMCPPQEEFCEEIYFYLIEPDAGFGIQRVYDPPELEGGLNEVYVVGSGDVVAIPRGYHPTVAAPGYNLYYLWALAGPRKATGACSIESAHVWIREYETILQKRNV